MELDNSSGHPFGILNCQVIKSRAELIQLEFVFEDDLTNETPTHHSVVTA